MASHPTGSIGIAVEMLLRTSVRFGMNCHAVANWFCGAELDRRLIVKSIEVPVVPNRGFGSIGSIAQLGAAFRRSPFVSSGMLERLAPTSSCTSQFLMTNVPQNASSLGLRKDCLRSRDK